MQKKFGTSAAVFFHVLCKIDNSEILPLFGYAASADNIHEARVCFLKMELGTWNNKTWNL